jgi:FkbM family methyltransferase
MRPCIGLHGALIFQLAEDWARLWGLVTGKETASEVQLWPKGNRKPVAVRLRSSDMQVFQQVFVWQQYKPATQIGEPKVIVDCGANVGYTSSYFLEHFPTARVIALEPDPHNADVCRRNLQPYGDRVLVLQKALWGSVAQLAFVENTRKKGDEWGIQVSTLGASQSEHMVEGIDITTLLATTGIDQIDLLKIDIEKSEAEVFRNHADSWLHRVHNIAIELHDSTCREVFYSALAKHTFAEEQRGEVTLCLNIRPLVTVS